MQINFSWNFCFKSIGHIFLICSHGHGNKNNMHKHSLYQGRKISTWTARKFLYLPQKQSNPSSAFHIKRRAAGRLLWISRMHIPFLTYAAEYRFKVEAVWPYGAFRGTDFEQNKKKTQNKDQKVQEVQSFSHCDGLNRQEQRQDSIYSGVFSQNPVMSHGPLILTCQVWGVAPHLSVRWLWIFSSESDQSLCN